MEEVVGIRISELRDVMKKVRVLVGYQTFSSDKNSIFVGDTKAKQSSKQFAMVVKHIFPGQQLSG